MHGQSLKPFQDNRDCALCDPDICAAHLDRVPAGGEREAADGERHDGARVRAERVHGRQHAEEARRGPRVDRGRIPRAARDAVRAIYLFVCDAADSRDRPLFFLENKELAQKARTAGLPPLIVLHHVLVRSPIPLPHKLHGWQEAEYVRYVNERTEEEAWTLVESGLSHWEKVSETEGTDISGAAEYVELAREVLRQAR